MTNWDKRIQRAANAFTGPSPEIVARKSSLITFHEEVIIHGSPEAVASPPFHLEMADELQLATQHLLTSPANLDIYEEDHNKILFLAPRGFAKSTIGTVTLPCYLLGTNNLLRIILISKVKENAVSFLRQIDHIMDNNDRYKELFGSLVPKSKRDTIWKTDSKTIVRVEPPGGLKDPSIIAVGAKGALPSRRAEVIIVDDLLDQENSNTPLLRAQLSRWFWNSLVPILVPWGVLIVLGTRWHANDLYSELIEKWEEK